VRLSVDHSKGWHSIVCFDIGDVKVNENWKNEEIGQLKDFNMYCTIKTLKKPTS